MSHGIYWNWFFDTNTCFESKHEILVNWNHTLSTYIGLTLGISFISSLCLPLIMEIKMYLFSKVSSLLWFPFFPVLLGFRLLIAFLLVPCQWIVCFYAFSSFEPFYTLSLRHAPGLLFTSKLVHISAHLFICKVLRPRLL